ncbi:MAG: hypothetical protein Q9193_004918 [Seirophora villosa]
MPPSKPHYDVDWIFSNCSDVHVANHRDWFTNYTPFSTNFSGGLSGTMTDNLCQVCGIGDVELPTKTHPTRSGTAYQATITLRNVLHAPSARCNIIGSPLVDEFDCSLKYGPPAGGKITKQSTGATVGLLDITTKLTRLRLRGQNASQTSLDPKAVYVIRANWHPSERAKWESFRAGRREAVPASSATPTSESSPLTPEEKRWLSVNYGGEFHFLRIYGLSIYKEEDRGEGRRILRAMRQESSSGEEDTDEDDEDSDSLSSFQRELEQDPSSHVADYHFSKEQLDVIKRCFGHSGNFLRSYCLKPYDDEDCLEGKTIVEALMSADEMPPLVD